MSKPRVRRIKKHEWKQYRETRLQALAESPQAFGSTYRVTKNISDGEWQDRLVRITEDHDLPLAAIVDKIFVGMAWAKFEDNSPKIIHLYQMWVSPAYRGSGIGRLLLSAAIEWAGKKGATSISLGVTCGDTPARKLYESVGFEVHGKPNNLRPDSDLLVQTMTCDIPHRQTL